MSCLLVSIVLPVYNCEKYIQESINSILNQTYKNIEIICIDDASTDKTFSILKNIKDSRLKLYQNSMNKGLIYTRNKGYSLSNGDFIANMDGDDISHSKRIEIQTEYMRTHPDIDVVGSHVSIISENGSFVKKWQPAINYSDIKVAFLFESCIANPSAMFRRNILLSNEMLDHEFYSVEDYEFFSRLALAGYRFSNINMVLLKYRIVESGMTLLNEKKSEFRDSVHKKVYKKNIQSLGFVLSERQLCLHRKLVSGEIKSLFGLLRLLSYLVYLRENIKSSEIDSKSLKKKISDLFIYCCLRSSNYFILPLNIVFSRRVFMISLYSTKYALKAIVRCRVSRWKKK